MGDVDLDEPPEWQTPSAEGVEQPPRASCVSLIIKTPAPGKKCLK